MANLMDMPLELPLGSRLVIGAMREFRKSHAFVDTTTNDIDLLAAAVFDALAPKSAAKALSPPLRTGWPAIAPEPPVPSQATTAAATSCARRCACSAATAPPSIRPGSITHLPDDCGPRVVMAGHPHAARNIRLDADRTYINTGTWSDLIPWPPLSADEDAKAFIDELEANKFHEQRQRAAQRRGLGYGAR